MNGNGKHSWLSSPASVIAIFTVVLNVMGFLAIRTFIVRMCLPTNFFEETPIDYLQWGAKAVVQLLFFIILATIIVAIIAVAGTVLLFILRQTVFRFKRVKGILEQVVHGLRTRIQGLNVARVTGILFITSLVIFLVYFIYQIDVIQGFWNPDISPEKFFPPTVFASSNKASLNIYPVASAILILILGFLLYFSNKARIRKNELESPSLQKNITSIIFTCATGSILLFVIVLWAMPYRLMFHNEFESVKYNHELAYIILEKEKDSRLFLYVPGACPFVIDQKDSLLERTGKRYYKNIFNN